MKTFSALLAICAGNSPVPGEFPIQRPVRRSFDVYFDLRPNKRLSKQSLGWWFETLSPSLWRHRNETLKFWDWVRLILKVSYRVHPKQNANGSRLFSLLWFTGRVDPYLSILLHQHWGNQKMDLSLIRQPSTIWVNDINLQKPENTMHLQKRKYNAKCVFQMGLH